MRIDRREWLEKYETTNLEFYYGSRLHEPVKVWTIDFEKVKMYRTSLFYFRPSSRQSRRMRYAIPVLSLSALCGDRQESFGTKLAPNVEK
jgi:hypothetical protein